jgi:hypothetical protein
MIHTSCVVQEKRTIGQDLFMVAELAWSIGWIIALPAVLFGFGGAYLDRYLGTSPLFLLIGMGCAMGLSGWGLYRKLREILTKQKN